MNPVSCDCYPWVLFPLRVARNTFNSSLEQFFKLQKRILMSLAKLFIFRLQLLSSPVPLLWISSICCVALSLYPKRVHVFLQWDYHLLCHKICVSLVQSTEIFMDIGLKKNIYAFPLSLKIISRSKVKKECSS